MESLEKGISECELWALEEGENQSILEKLPLPKFSGNSLEYVEFKNLISALLVTPGYQKR